MMSILNRNQDLPRDRVELYRHASRVLLHEWDASRSLSVDTFGRQEKESLLRSLAGEMQQSEGGLAGNLIEREALIKVFREFLKGLDIPDPHGKALDLVKQLTERNFILCFAGADRFSFVHRTFLEFFCADWFREQVQVQRSLSLEELKAGVYCAHWKDENWHEVLRLVVGMLGERDAEELIVFLMSRDDEGGRFTHLILAAGCLSEVRNRKAMEKTSAALKQLVTAAVNVPIESGEDRHEYEACRSAVSMFVYVWRSDGASDWLKSLVKTSANDVARTEAVLELTNGWRDDPDTLELLKECVRSDTDLSTRMVAMQLLTRDWENDPNTLELLKNLARSDADKFVRVFAIQVLAHDWKNDPNTLPFLKDRARCDTDDYVRSVGQELIREWKDDPDNLRS